MKYTEANLGRIFILRLEHGDRIPDVIEEFARVQNVQSAAVFFVGGSEPESKVVVGPEDGTVAKPVPAVVNLPGVSEAVGVGTIFTDEQKRPKLHMHSAFGRDMQTITGCTREGVVIWQIGEVILLELTNHSALRKINPQNGFELLEVQNINTEQNSTNNPDELNVDEIKKLLNDLRAEKPRNAADSAEKELMRLDVAHAEKLIPLIEDAIKEAHYESDFVWLAFLAELVQEKRMKGLLSPDTAKLLDCEEFYSDLIF